VTIASLIVSVGADVGQLVTDVKKIHGQFDGIASGAKKMAGVMAGAFAAIDFGGAAKAAVDAASQIADASQMIGESAEMTQRLTFAAEQGGASLGNVATAMKGMAEALGGKDGGAKLLEDLGLTLADISGKSPGQVFLTMAEAIRQIPDPLRQSDLATDAFGKTGTELLPAIKAGFVEIGNAAPIMAEKTVASLDEVGDKWAATQQRIDNLKAEALEPLLSLFASMPASFQTVAGGILAFMPSLETLALGFLAIGGPSGAMAALTTAGAVVATFFTATLPAAFAAILPFLGPIGLIAAGVTAVIVAWRNWDTIKSIAQSVYTAVKEWLVDKFAAVVKWIGEKVDQVTGFFRDMYDKVVGQSYVPDMINRIAAEFGRLPSVMVTPAQDAISSVTGGFASMLSFVDSGLNSFSGLMGDVFGPRAQSAMNTLQRVFKDGASIVNGVMRGLGGDITGWAQATISAIDLVRSAWNGIKRLVGGGEEGIEVNPARDTFFQQFVDRYGLSPFDSMAAAFAEAGISGDVAEQMIKALYAADTMAEFRSAAQAIVEAVGHLGFGMNFHRGGMVPGNGEVNAKLLGGEYVANRGEVAMMRRVLGSLDRLDQRIGQAVGRAVTDAMVMAG
jgi:hypothetical protein